jgi:hypothetical protein
MDSRLTLFPRRDLAQAARRVAELDQHAVEIRALARPGPHAGESGLERDRRPREAEGREDLLQEVLPQVDRDLALEGRAPERTPVEALDAERHAPARLRRAGKADLDPGSERPGREVAREPGGQLHVGEVRRVRRREVDAAV